MIFRAARCDITCGLALRLLKDRGLGEMVDIIKSAGSNQPSLRASAALVMERRGAAELAKDMKEGKASAEPLWARHERRLSRTLSSLPSHRSGMVAATVSRPGAGNCCPFAETKSVRLP